jgi:hypothetical protein
MKALHMQGLCAFIAFAGLALVILVRQRKLTLEDIGSLFAAFTAASSLPVAIHLCTFSLPVPADPSRMMLPDLYALYISAGGLTLLIASCITICKLFAARLPQAIVGTQSAKEASANDIVERPG